MGRNQPLAQPKGCKRIPATYPPLAPALVGCRNGWRDKHIFLPEQGVVVGIHAPHPSLWQGRY